MAGRMTQKASVAVVERLSTISVMFVIFRFSFMREG